MSTPLSLVFVRMVQEFNVMAQEEPITTRVRETHWRTLTGRYCQTKNQEMGGKRGRQIWKN